MQKARKHVRTAVLVVVLLACLLGCLYYLLSRSTDPVRVQYGVSFNTLYARELGLPWEDVYRAILIDLGVRHVRLAAHWPMVEPEKGVYSFEELDTQVRLAEEYGADVVLVVGRRAPRWPECHVPSWAHELTWDEQKAEILAYVEAVVTRYKDSPAIAYWQVENEPFLSVFAYEHCGNLDKEFLDQEIGLVRKLDPTRPVLVTDSGNLGLWYGAYRRGDAFGTSVYVYLWNETVGPFKSRLPASFYRAKAGLMRTMFGKKEVILIELSAEPWLLTPVVDAPIETQLARMNVDKLNEVIDFARKTNFTKQYLWGAEWWYWMRENGHSEMWERARELYLDKS